MIAQFSGTIYPDKTFSIGRCPSPKITAEDRRYERNREAQYDWYIETTKTYDGVKHTPRRFFKEQVYHKPIEKSASPLFIKGSELSPDSKKQYGSHGITRLGKKSVTNAALLYEREYKKSRLGFVTCTLPGVNEKLLRIINRNWGEIVRRFYQKLRRHLRKLGIQFQYVGVTEIQEKRFKKTGLPCPHLHFVYVARDKPKSPYYLYVCQIHRAWNTSINEVLNKTASHAIGLPKNTWGSVHCAVVKKSAAAYLGKYISKGCKVLKDMMDNGWNEFPKQWWSMDVLTKKMFRASLISLDSKTCEAMFYGLEHYLQEGLIKTAYFVSIDLGDRSLTVGLSGIVSSEFYRAMS